MYIYWYEHVKFDQHRYNVFFMDNKKGASCACIEYRQCFIFFSLKSEESIKKQIETCISAASATTIKNWKGQGISNNNYPVWQRWQAMKKQWTRHMMGISILKLKDN